MSETDGVFPPEVLDRLVAGAPAVFQRSLGDDELMTLGGMVDEPWSVVAGRSGCSIRERTPLRLA